MAMPAMESGAWTIDMLDALPDDGQRYEIIDGELFVTPSPNPPHQIIAGAIYAELRSYLRGSTVGYPMISPSDVWRGERKTNRVQPDVFVARLADGRRGEFPFPMKDLLLAVEVESPSNPLLDYQVKRDLYMREGIPEYWIVSPEARNVSRWRGSDDPGEVLSKRVVWHPEGMPAPFVLELDALFEEAFG
jgi:Uma2 family endonuclease